MKKKRHTTEEIIRILGKADGEKTVEEACGEANIRGADPLPGEEGVCLERRACRYLGLHRSSCQYRAQEALEQTRKLVKRIVWLSRKYPATATGGSEPFSWVRDGKQDSSLCNASGEWKALE